MTSLKPFTDIVLSGSCLKHGSQEASGEGKARQPEENGRVGHCGPGGELVHSLNEVPGPGTEGLL